jgi:SAM-dependent MidA family methyltransferase
MKKKQINEQLAILTKREYMGNLFKVLEINI